MKKCCEDFGPTKLEIGDKAQVPKKQARNAIRCAPRKERGSDNIRAWIPAEREMTILYGPVCEDKYLWWAIKTTNAQTQSGQEIDKEVEGWTAEWERGKGYYLETVYVPPAD
jgi:hypothetical protein